MELFDKQGPSDAFLTPEELAADDPLERPASDFEKYTGPPLTEEMVRAAEATLGVKLPQALIELFQERNGGFLRRRYFPAPSLEEGVIELRQMRGLGWERGLDSDTSSLYMAEEWEYPKGLLWLEGDGHTGVFLDYRSCGPQGEPSVAWVDTEADDPSPHPLAPDFATFVKGLQEGA